MKIQILDGNENIDQIYLNSKELNMRLSYVTEPMAFGLETGDPIPIHKMNSAQITFKDTLELDALIEMLIYFRREIDSRSCRWEVTRVRMKGD